MTTVWEPTDYHGIGNIPDGNSIELLFQVDCYGPKKNRVVPITWFSTDKLKYLYPPKDYKVGGVGPDKWSATTFDRHYYPKENWTQHKVGTLELQTFRKFLKARNIERQLTAGVKKNLISDSNTPARGIATGKRRKAVTKEKETTQLTQQSNGSLNQNTARDDSRFLLDLPPGPLPPQTTKVTNEDYDNSADIDGHTLLNLGNSKQMETNAANIRIESHLVTTPFAKNSPPQFTEVHPSSNLSIGPIPSATSPTIDSSLLTLIPPTVDSLPSSQFNKQLSPANSTDIESLINAANFGIGFQFTRRTGFPSNLPTEPISGANPSTRDSSLMPTLVPATVNALPSSSQSNNPLSPANSTEIESLGTNAANAGSYLVTTPFANNLQPQFARRTGYPSNLPMGPISSAASTSSDSSLLTPSTVNSLPCSQSQKQHSPEIVDLSPWGSTSEQYPSRNFQTGQHEENCCQGVLAELQNLQNEVRQLSSLICKSLRSNSTHSNSRRVLDYHRSFVQNLIGECPKNSVRSVVDLNTALKDPKLAISMVMVLVNASKTSKTINSFANSVYDKLVSPGTSQGMQWKSSERGSDCRQGLSHLDSLLAVIGICITGYGAERKIECSTSRVIKLIQNARKLSSQIYRKSNNISDLEAKTSAKTSVPVSFPDENCCDVVSNLEQKISFLSDAVEKFVPQFPE